MVDMIIESSAEFLIQTDSLSIECRKCGDWSKGLTHKEIQKFKEGHEHKRDDFYIQCNEQGEELAVVKMTPTQQAVMEKAKRDAAERISWRKANEGKFATHEEMVEAYKREFGL